MFCIWGQKVVPVLLKQLLQVSLKIERMTSSNFLLVLIKRNSHLTEFQQEHWVHICLSWQAHSHQVHNVQVPESLDHIHIFWSTCLVGSFMKTRASLSRSSVPVLRVLVFTATCPQAFHLELFQNIDWQSHSEAMSQSKTFYAPQFSNQDWAWAI